MNLLAHSGRLGKGIPPQSYSDHVREVARLAKASAAAVSAWQEDPEFLHAVCLSATWHDLGKLDPENQAILESNSRECLAVKHEYAGVRHLRKQGQGTAATLVYSHHRGLPNLGDVLFQSTPLDEALEETTLERCDDFFSDMLRKHCEATQDATEMPCRTSEWRVEAMRRSGLFWRMALSCLVDADHADTARHYRRETDPKQYQRRWAERLASLDRYVSELASNPEVAEDRKALRQAVYLGCRDLDAAQAMYACDSGGRFERLHRSATATPSQAPREYRQ